MTQQEIEHFQLLSSLVLQVGDKKFILRDKELKNKYNINFEYLLELEECGLMSSQPLGLTLTSFREQPVYIHNSQIIGVIRRDATKNRTICFCFYKEWESIVISNTLKGKF